MRKYQTVTYRPDLPQAKMICVLGPPAAMWILTTGFWNDDGAWRDRLAYWID